jgi:hypothetical protein
MVKQFVDYKSIEDFWKKYNKYFPPSEDFAATNSTYKILYIDNIAKKQIEIKTTSTCPVKGITETKQYIELDMYLELKNKYEKILQVINEY